MTRTYTRVISKRFTDWYLFALSVFAFLSGVGLLYYGPTPPYDVRWNYSPEWVRTVSAVLGTAWTVGPLVYWLSLIRARRR